MAVIKIFSRPSDTVSRQPEIFPQRNLALAVIRQAWSEAVVDLGLVTENKRPGCIISKQEAIDWICSDDDGFLYWCQLADLDHSEVRRKLFETLNSQRISADRESRDC